MQVHRNNVITAGHDNHIRDQFGRDGRARLILFVHPGIRETWNDGSNPTGRGSLACRYQDEKLHEIVIHIAASGLDDENVLFSYGFKNFDVDLATREPSDSAGC